MLALAQHQTPTLQPEETTRQQTSLVLHMLHVGTQHQTSRLQPEEMSRQQTSLVLHMLHVGTRQQTPRRQPEEEMTRQQTTDKSCSPHASCWHPAPNTQTTTRGQQTNLVLHMLHVGTQHQPPRPRQSRCGRHGLSNILKLQAMFLYSIYHQ